MKQLICEHCKKEFTIKWYKPSKPQRYCSRQCSGKAKQIYEHTLICEMCGEEFDNSHNGGRKAKFCSHKCRTEGKKDNITAVCSYCKKEFPTIKSSIKKWKNNYCSKECRLKNGWNKPDPSKKSIFTCKWCSKEFETWTYRQPEFCSMQCISEYAARQPKPNARRPENFLTIKCETCGSKYKIHKGVIENSGRNSRFCSSDCMYAAMSKERMGENNPNFVHGLTHLYPGRGQNWPSQRRKALKRDNHTCQVCHKQKKVMHVHHIVPYVSFDNNWEKANRLSNLVTLCQNCHPKVERGKISCPLPNT